MWKSLKKERANEAIGENGEKGKIDERYNLHSVSSYRTEIFPMRQRDIGFCPSAHSEGNCESGPYLTHTHTETQSGDQEIIQ